jgi:ketosteroid isomerase-like protein
MKKKCCYLILLLSIFSCNERSETDNETQKRIDSESLEAKKSIDKNNKQIEKWYKTKRADSLINYLADNGIQFPPNNEPLRGKESVRKYWEQLFQFGNIDFSLQTQNIKANGPMAVELGKYSFKFSPNQNSPIPAIVDSGNYLVYWEKINGNWKVVWDAPVSTIPLPQK